MRMVWPVVLAIVVVGAILALPPALMLILRVAKLDLYSEGVVVIPALNGAAFSLASAVIMASLMFLGADLLCWTQMVRLKLGRPTLRHCAYGVLIGIALVLGLFLLSQGQIESHSLMKGLSQSSSATDIVMYVVSLGLIMPFGEEYLFRGSLDQTLRAALGSTASLVISTLAFALAHGISVQIGFYVFAGVSFALLSRKSQSLIPPMLAHITFNLLTVAYVLAK